MHGALEGGKRAPQTKRPWRVSELAHVTRERHLLAIFLPNRHLPVYPYRVESRDYFCVPEIVHGIIHEKMGVGVRDRRGVENMEVHEKQRSAVLLGRNDGGDLQLRLSDSDTASIQLRLDVLFEDLERLWACAVWLQTDWFRVRVEIRAMVNWLDRAERDGIPTAMRFQNCHDAHL